jgi:hypothetical protein
MTATTIRNPARAALLAVTALRVTAVATAAAAVFAASAGASSSGHAVPAPVAAPAAAWCSPGGLGDVYVAMHHGCTPRTGQVRP